MNIKRYFKQFNWRFLLVRIVVNALALALTAAIIPKIYFVDKSFANWVFMALMLGVLNALLKPILQFMTLQFIFVTYGLVLVLVNSLLLWLLSIIFPNRFAVENLLWLLVGGLVLGLISSFLENLLGLTMPVVPDEPPDLRLHVEEQARQVEWLDPASSDRAADELTEVIEQSAAEVNDTEPAGEEPATALEGKSTTSAEGRVELTESSISESEPAASTGGKQEESS